jgi:hypothetical protein
MSDYAYVDQHHVPHVEGARDRVRRDPAVLALLSDTLDGPAQLRFLLEFYATAVGMLRPVEHSLVLGAIACGEWGFDTIADDFRRMSKDAASRRLRLLDDFVQLAWLWREQGGEAIDLAALVRRPASPAVVRHMAVREAAANNSLPLVLLGVELELAELAIELGPRLVRASERKLGGDVLARLTYFHAWTEHAALRADDLLERLDDLLRSVPELAEPVATAGVDAVTSMLDVFGDCIVRSSTLGRTRPSSFVTTSP